MLWRKAHAAGDLFIDQQQTPGAAGGRSHCECVQQCVRQSAHMLSPDKMKVKNICVAVVCVLLEHLTVVGLVFQ